MTDFETHPVGTADLVKRLREDAVRERLHALEQDFWHEEILIEAADRIEQLEAALTLANAATAERLIATQNGWHVPTDHIARLKFADKLDAYLWAMHHRAPDNGEWADAREWLIWSADRLGIRNKLEDGI